MALTKTTIMVSEVLMNRVGNHIKNGPENMSTFISRAILNQLESDGDYEIRDLVEEDVNACCEKTYR